MFNYTQQKFRLGTMWADWGYDPKALSQNFPWLGDCACVARGIDAPDKLSVLFPCK